MTDQELTHELHRSTNRHLNDIANAIGRLTFVVLAIGVASFFF